MKEIDQPLWSSRDRECLTRAVKLPELLLHVEMDSDALEVVKNFCRDLLAYVLRWRSTVCTIDAFDSLFSYLAKHSASLFNPKNYEAASPQCIYHYFHFTFSKNKKKQRYAWSTKISKIWKNNTGIDICCKLCAVTCLLHKIQTSAMIFVHTRKSPLRRGGILFGGCENSEQTPTWVRPLVLAAARAANIWSRRAASSMHL